MKFNGTSKIRFFHKIEKRTNSSKITYELNKHFGKPALIDVQKGVKVRNQKGYHKHKYSNVQNRFHYRATLWNPGRISFLYSLLV